MRHFILKNDHFIKTGSGQNIGKALKKESGVFLQLEASHVALYKRFGDWIRSCYGTPVGFGVLNGTGALPLTGAAGAGGAEAEAEAEAYELEVTFPATGKKNGSFEPFEFIHKVYLFTKIGSGQTWGKLEKDYRFLIGAPIDRLVLQEDQREGQRILSYQVVDVSSGAVCAKGTSVGNKKIDLLASNVTGTLRLEVLSTARGLPPLVRFSGYAHCPSG